MATRFCGGMSTPAILAICLLTLPLTTPRNLRFRGDLGLLLSSTLPLFVLGRLGADHADHSVALDHPAAGTHLPDRRTYLHLQISRIRPRDRSLDASSTPTLSPARSRVK